MKAWFLLAALVALSGCVGSFSLFGSAPAGDGLVLEMEANPPQVFEKGVTLLSIDIDNRGTRTLKNLVVDVFDTGIAKKIDTAGREDPEACGVEWPLFPPGRFESISCRLLAPDVTSSTETTVHSRARWSNELHAVQLVEMITQAEHERRQASGSLVQKPSVYTHLNEDLAVEVDFREPLPIVVRDKPMFVTFTIRNVGGGLVGPLESTGFERPGFFVEQSGSVVDCSQTQQDGWTLMPSGKEFPTISCELNPPDVNFLQNYAINVTVSYDYEIRDELSIRITK